MGASARLKCNLCAAVLVQPGFNAGRSFKQPSPLTYCGTGTFCATGSQPAGVVGASPQKRRGERVERAESEVSGGAMAKTARRARTAKRPHDQVTLMLDFIALDTMEGESVSHNQLEAGLLSIWEWYSEVVARGNCNYVVGYKIKADSVDPADVGTFPTDAVISQLPSCFEKGRERPGPEVLFMVVEVEWMTKRRNRCWVVLDVRRRKHAVRCWTFIRGMKCDMGINQWVHHPQNYLRKFTLQVCSPDEVEERSWMSGHCSFAAVQYFIENYVRSGGYAVRKLPSACVTGYRHKAITHQSGED